MKIKDSFARRVFVVCNYIILGLLSLSCLLPLINLFAISFSARAMVDANAITFWPKGFNTAAYEYILSNKQYFQSFGITIGRVVLGWLINLVLIVLVAYPLSKDDPRIFRCRKYYTWFFLVTMVFNGGLIPTYLVVSKLGLINTRWAMIIPGAMSVYNMIVTRTYFMNSIPPSLQEAATLDGASSFQYLVRVVLPLSKPILAVIGLYYAVGHWNDFYSALIYLYDDSLLPLQSFLRDILMSTKLTLNNTSSMDMATVAAKAQLAQTLKYSVIIVSTVPVLCIYPFIQKYFVKGVMIGSVKG